ERQQDETFVTVCEVTIPPDRAGAVVRLAGHPPPILLRPVPTVWPGVVSGPPLGVMPGHTWPGAAAELAGPWAVLLYTDGLIEGRRPGSGERLGVDGLTERLRAAGIGGGGRGPDGGAGAWEAGLSATLAWAEEQHGGPLADDVALMLLASDGAGGGPEPGRRAARPSGSGRAAWRCAGASAWPSSSSAASAPWLWPSPPSRSTTCSTPAPGWWAGSTRPCWPGGTSPGPWSSRSPPSGASC